MGLDNKKGSSNIMARCQICSKSSQSGNNVSHSKRRTRTKWQVNTQKATVNVNGTTKQLSVCTRCLRTMYKN